MFDCCKKCMRKIIRKIRNYFSNGYCEIPSSSPPEEYDCVPQTQWKVREEDMPQHMQAIEWEPSPFPRAALRNELCFIKQEPDEYAEDPDSVVIYYKYPSEIIKIKHSKYLFRSGFLPCSCHNPNHYTETAQPYYMNGNSNRWLKFLPQGSPRTDGTFIHQARKVATPL